MRNDRRRSQNPDDAVTAHPKQFQESGFAASAGEISPDAKFAQLGVDSILAVKPISEFDKRFAMGISPRYSLAFRPWIAWRKRLRSAGQPASDAIGKQLKGRRGWAATRPAICRQKISAVIVNDHVGGL